MNAYMYIFIAITKLVSGGNSIAGYSIIALVITAIALVVIALQEKDSWDYQPAIKHYG